MGDVVRGESDMLLELIDGPSEFLAGVRFEHFLKVAIAEIPDVLLGLGVFNPRNLTIPDSVRERLLRYHFFALPIFGIAESGVICLLDSVTRGESPLADVIEVVDDCGKPGHLWGADYDDLLSHLFKVSDGLGHMNVGDLALEIRIEVDHHLLVDDFRWPRLYPREVDSVLGEHIQRLLKYPWPVLQRDGY